jgi:F-type H+-transporting ATPase subunit alpha
MRKTIGHGQPIRACLKQPQFQSVTVPKKIAVLLALNAGVFDVIPLERMTEAEQAVQRAASQIPSDILQRLFSAAELSQRDRETILGVAKNAVTQFQEVP